MLENIKHSTVNDNKTKMYEYKFLQKKPDHATLKGDLSKFQLKF